VASDVPGVRPRSCREAPRQPGARRPALSSGQVPDGGRSRMGSEPS
jgi:hypothetical protein